MFQTPDRLTALLALVAVALVPLGGRAADPPGWRVRTVAVKQFGGNRIESACVTADGRYAVAVDDRAHLAAIDLADPAARPAGRTVAFARAVAPGTDPKVVWVGGTGGRLFQVKVPSLEVTDLGRAGGDDVSGLAEVGHGFLLAVAADRQAHVLRVGGRRPEPVLTVHDVWGWAAARPAGAEVVYLYRSGLEPRPINAGREPAALRVRSGAVGLELGTRGPLDEATPALRGATGGLERTASADPDGRRWVVPVEHPGGQFRLRSNPTGKGDVVLPLKGRVAVSPTRPDRVFAADDDGLWVYDAGAKARTLLVPHRDLPGAADGLVVAPDGATCVLLAGDLSGHLVVVQRADLKK